MFQRLQKINVCISHQTLNSIISKVGLKFDRKVIQWRGLLLGELNVPGQVLMVVFAEVLTLIVYYRLITKYRMGYPMFHVSRWNIPTQIILMNRQLIQSHPLALHQFHH